MNFEGTLRTLINIQTCSLTQKKIKKNKTLTMKTFVNQETNNNMKKGIRKVGRIDTGTNTVGKTW